MFRWLILLTVAAQVSPVLAQEKCGVSRLARDNLSVFVMMKQQGNEKPFADHISFTSRSSDGKLELRTPYIVSSSKLLTPYMLFIDTRPDVPSDGKSPEMIKWQFDDGEWFTYPYRYNYPDQRGGVSYKIAQSGSPGLSFRTEWLDKVLQGGRFTVVRVLENRQEIAMGSVEYPENKIIADIFEEARSQALARLAPCGPPLSVVPRRSPK